MSVNQHILPPQRFSDLTQRERLFLYLVRHWGQQVSQRSKLQETDIQGTAKSSVAPQRRKDVALDLFMCFFKAALPEPLMLQPPQCRCCVCFHEATLLAVFRSAVRSDIRGLNRDLADMMPQDAIERIATYLRPVTSEIELALAELYQPSASSFPERRL